MGDKATPRATLQTTRFLIRGSRSRSIDLAAERPTYPCRGLKQIRTRRKHYPPTLVRIHPVSAFSRYRVRRMAATNPLFLYSVRSSRNWDEARTSMSHARICEAMAHVVAERGYSAVTVADVVSAARISRRTFYEHFVDKEACFLETYR